MIQILQYLSKSILRKHFKQKFLLIALEQKMQVKYQRNGYIVDSIQHDESSIMVDERQDLLPPQFRDKMHSVSFTSRVDTSKQQFKQSQQKKFDSASNLLDHEILQELKAYIAKKSLLPQILNSKINTNYDKDQFTVYFFNTDRKLSFQRESQIKDLQKSIRSYIPYIVSSYCKYFLNFDPEEIPDIMFSIKLADFNYNDDQIIDQFNLDWSIQRLFEAGNLVLIRKEIQKEILQALQLSAEQSKIRVQIIAPNIQAKQQLLINQKIKDLKRCLVEKNYCDDIDELIVVDYYDLSVLQPEQELGKLKNKIIQLFKHKQPVYQDKPKLSIDKNHKIVHKQEKKEDIKVKLELKEGFFIGKIILEIQNDKIIQKCQGGAFSKILSLNYPKVRSIHNLVGISKHNEIVQLKFKFKNRDQIVTYDFGSQAESQKMLRYLLKIERIFNKKFKNFRQVASKANI